MLQTSFVHQQQIQHKLMCGEAQTALICMSGTQWAQPIQTNQQGNLWAQTTKHTTDSYS